MADLKACPFCGNRAVVVAGLLSRNLGKFSVCCGMCFCSTPWEISKENAVFTWNRRYDNGTE